MSFPQSTPEVTRWCALIVAIILIVPTVVSVVGSAVKAEWTGTALYAPNPRLPATEQVTRNASPEKFRDAVLMDCFRAALFGGLTFVSFYFY